ncbi:MAG: NAD(P)H-dependent oxidoreductase subunit E [Planctomycetes bacterium]|nr:NAD(P)H-dependent oxidoreductase subunit E [Planctomycetota bacterium]
MPKTFNAKTMEKFQALSQRYPTKDALLLPVLRLAEEEFNGIDDDAMELVAGLVGVPPAKVMSVFTFYTHYRRAGSGKYLLQVCSTLPCALRGSQEIFEHLKKKLGIDSEETTKDGKFTLKKVECLGSCGTSPVVQINEDYYENLTTEKLDEILNKLQ